MHRSRRHQRVRCGCSARLASALALVASTLLIAAQPGSAADLPPGVRESVVTGPPTDRWGEPEVAINPRNADNLAYVALGNPIANTAAGPVPNGTTADAVHRSHVSVFVSFDRGKTWQKSTDVPGQIPVFPPTNRLQAGQSADPMITAGPDGTFYFAWDAFHFANTTTFTADYGGIATSKSIDGGRTWSAPVFTGTTTDRPFLLVDQSTGIVYEASTGPIPSPMASGDPDTKITGASDRYLVSSRDGVHWTKPQPFGGGGLYLAPAHGMLAAAFKTSDKSNALCGDAPQPCTIFQTTKDAGATWQRHVMPVSNAYEAMLNIRLMLAADPSKRGHYAVGIFTDSDTKITVYQTKDAGRSWSTPVAISEDTSKTHYHGWMAYSPKGVLGLMWKTRNAPIEPSAAAGRPAGAGLRAPAPFSVFAVISRDGGTTFTQPLKISGDEVPDPSSNTGGDDFSYLVMSKDEAYVAYARGDRAGVFTAVRLDAFGH